MWDFSWLERRWSGAGYEDWDRALDELQERGYDALRLECYPHLTARDPDRPWTLLPPWNIHAWGSPRRITVQVLPALHEFVARCGARGIKVCLSTWFREDVDNIRRQIATPRAHAELWLKTIDRLRGAGLLQHIVSVDLCNEFPGESWAPFFDNSPHSSWDGTTDAAIAWMRGAVEAFRAEEPALAATVSFNGFNPARRQEWAFLDFIENHIWMVHAAKEFYPKIGYDHGMFDWKGYEALAQHGEATFRADEDYWLGRLRERIRAWADISRACGRPMMTTECWAVINYRDWPGLDWGWVKEICAFGVEEALATGRWLGVSTSNFCGPQFVGMWRDVAWHQRLTKAIRTARTEFSPGAREGTSGSVAAPR
jgi:hypothetical protein